MHKITGELELYINDTSDGLVDEVSKDLRAVLEDFVVARGNANRRGNVTVESKTEDFF